MVRLAIRRILACNHVVAKGRNGIGNKLARVPVAANKLSRRGKGQVQDVVEDKHLAVAVWPCADANRWSLNLGGNQSGDFPRNAFEHQESYARTIQSHRIAHELFDCGQRLALHLVAAHYIHRLRGKSDMAGDGNLRVDYATNNKI